MDDECKHGMNSEWCADCLGHLSAEEEEDREEENAVRHWANIVHRWGES